LHSKFGYVYLINTKNEALNMFKTYKAEVENQLDEKIKILRSDRGGEYESNDFAEFCFTFGIVNQTTSPYTPQQNRVAEHKNRTLKNMINSMLITSGAPHSLWGEASKISASYRFLVYKSNIKNISNNTIIESAEADFFENIFPYKDKEKQISEIPQENVKPRRIKRAKVTKDFGPDYMTNTWKLVDLPLGHKPIGHKWIFKKKLGPDGTIEKYKARLVAKGYRQKEGQDFFDTYSPVTRITSIRTLIAIAVIHNLIIHQMDVKIVFLNGELDEEIYMQQPEGFVVKGQEHKVCKLVKSLYGLKQAPKQWHEKFDNTLLSNDFQINECDKCVYVKQYKNAFVIICLYVDDILTAVCIHCDSMTALTRAKNQIYNGKSRHIRRRHNTIKDLLRNGIISIDYVKSKENIVDPLTKGLCREQVIFTSRVEYYGIFLIGITYTRLMCGRIFENQMTKFSKILMNKDMFTTEMNTTTCLIAMVAVISVAKVSVSEPS
ncbi:retrovirus-related pol polyprotein from transposon TNT 1-94, partial [Tanacetum coccineum]